MQVSEQLRQVLHPSRFPTVTGPMASILGYILDVHVTAPAISGLCVMADGQLFARYSGEVGYRHPVGVAADVDYNWRRLLDAAEVHGGRFSLTPKLRQEAERLYQQRIRRLGSSG